MNVSSLFKWHKSIINQSKVKISLNSELLTLNKVEKFDKSYIICLKIIYCLYHMQIYH